MHVTLLLQPTTGDIVTMARLMSISTESIEVWQEEHKCPGSFYCRENGGDAISCPARKVASESPNAQAVACKHVNACDMDLILTQHLSDCTSTAVNYNY